MALQPAAAGAVIAVCVRGAGQWTRQAPWARLELGLLHPLYGYAGVRATGYGDEVFAKHIADHMHTVKYKTIGGAQKTLQELGFKYHLRTTNVPIKIMDWLRFTYVLQDRY
jgi:hypothetical protein